MSALSRILIIVGCLCAGGGLACLPPARADTQVFPVPAVSSTRNDGNEAGLIVPIMLTDPDGELKYLMAPMVIHNSIVGTRGVFNLFRYEPGGRETRFVASLTEKIERKILFSYTDPAFSNGRYFLQFGGTYFKNATARFFGIGQDSTAGDETNYTAREYRANWRFGIYANEVTQISVGQRFRDVQLQPGATDLPYTVARFGDVPGVNATAIRCLPPHWHQA